MRVLIYGINFTPELIGIGKYTGEMAEWLADRGHEVRVVTALPYYPEWRVREEYSKWKYKIEINKFPSSQTSTATRERELSPYIKAGRTKCNVSCKIYRCPVWVPKKPSGFTRLLHLMSFQASSFPILIWQVFWRPEVVLVVEPTLFCVPQGCLVAWLAGAWCWLHVQDLEVDTAFDSGIMKTSWIRCSVSAAESWLMKRFDRVSTISRQMQNKLESKGVEKEKILFFPNWVDTTQIKPLTHESILRSEIGVRPDQIMVLYSGNMGEKQGIEIVIEAARLLTEQTFICFVMCGQGAAYSRLKALAKGLENIIWIPLQPIDQLNNLLNAADIHLLPQRVEVADLFMPSKLTGIMASGRPVVATVNEGTEIWQVVHNRGLVVIPGNAKALSLGILNLAKNPAHRIALAANARKYVVDYLEKEVVLENFETALLNLIKKTGNKLS